MMNKKVDQAQDMPQGDVAGSTVSTGTSADRHRGSGASEKPTGQARSVPLCTDGDQMSTTKPSVTLNSRAELAALLRDAGLSRAAAEKVSKGGWPELAGDKLSDELANSLAAQAQELALQFRSFADEQDHAQDAGHSARHGERGSA